jgi:hypothetical protein
VDSATGTGANLYGVWAKWERAKDQLTALHKEVLAFGEKPDAWTIRSQVNHDAGRYLFKLDPNWGPGLVLYWGAIIGEMVHDVRSALDQLVWQLVLLNGAVPGRHNKFPICADKPAKGFEQMRREWTDRGDRLRRGELLGVSDQAFTVIERCQPYHGGNRLLLRWLHKVWNTDKHQHLIPMALLAEEPSLALSDGAFIIDKQPSRFDGNTYVMEGTFGGTRPHPHVDVNPHPPRDIVLDDGVAVIEIVRRTLQFTMLELLCPLGDLFPGDRGVGLPK